MSLQEYKCPNCGGGIQYNPGTQELVCPYCESVIDIDALRATDAEAERFGETESMNWDYNGSEWRAGEQDGMVVYSCNSCSGEIVGDETLGAATCPFCGNPVVMVSTFSGALRPDMILPFKLGKDEAIAALQKHYLGKRLLPSVFKDWNHLEEVKGVYVPFWLYDADARAHIEYNATRTRFWSDRHYNYTETSTFRVVREGVIGFDRVPVDGSKAIDDTLMESIEPYSLAGAADFQSAYLAGFYANKYDVGSTECSPRAYQRIKNSTSSEFAATVTGYTSVTPYRTNISLLNGGVRYALLPVWLLGTSWEGRKFTFAMNGQTGKFMGDLPLDKTAFWQWFMKIGGVAAAVLLIISMIYVSFV